MLPNDNHFRATIQVNLLADMVRVWVLLWWVYFLQYQVTGLKERLRNDLFLLKLKSFHLGACRVEIICTGLLVICIQMCPVWGWRCK